MAATISDEIHVDGSVVGFVGRKGVRETFQRIRELASSCFPSRLYVEATLQEDPDEAERARVVVCVRLPEAYPDAQLEAGMRRYHEQIITLVPLEHCPLFALVTEFGSE